MATRLRELPPEKIKRNPENPRMHFPSAGLDKLAESIEESGGVLVPVYVYPDPQEKGLYRLIDGERRWLMAGRLGLRTIPALVRDSEPDPAKNIIEMFNIHKVREDWDDMPTAIALREVMKRAGTRDADQLKQMTGLSKEQIGRYKLILELPQRYQDMIDNGSVPMNFFVELDRNVIRPLARSRKTVAREFTPEKLRKAFLAKRKSGAMKDVIDLRDVRPIIDRAAADAGSPDAPSALDDFLRLLFKNKTATVQEVYDRSVSFAIESDNLAEQADQVVAGFARLLGRAGGADRSALVTKLRSTQQALTALLEEHSGDVGT